MAGVPNDAVLPSLRDVLWRREARKYRMAPENAELRLYYRIPDESGPIVLRNMCLSVVNKAVPTQEYCLQVRSGLTIADILRIQCAAHPTLPNFLAAFQEYEVSLTILSTFVVPPGDHILNHEDPARVYWLPTE